MLATLNLKVGSILHDMEQNIDHRVIYMNKDYLVTILINVMLAYKQDQSKRENLHQWYNRKRMIQRQRKAKENGK